MNAFFQSMVVPAIRGNTGVYWCAGWFAIQGMTALVVAILDDGIFSTLLALVFGALCIYAALGLLRALKPAWHVATFLAFLMIILNSVAIACAPGEIADGDKHLLEAAFDIVLLAIFILVYSRLRKPGVRSLYGVPETYRPEPS
ncbi:MAG: hypothetical protein KY410_10850 [Proteobacteria bacterium]|nr:hypothetical protein [Pseudomonadota bacterium]